MKQLFLLIFAICIVYACGNTPSDKKTRKEDPTNAMIKAGKGVGEIKEVELSLPLDPDRIGKGQAIYDLKCAACHRLNEKRLVGPGLKDVTNRRKPEWIMNMITNVDIMLDKDPEAQKLLQECLTRMPNQNVSLVDARDVLEFFRKNDGE